MKIQLDQEDIEAIAKKVVEMLAPLLNPTGGGQNGDTIFGVDGLAAYLGVSKDWIYQNQKAIPHFKVGRFNRYRKSEIDSWLGSMKVHPSDPLQNRFRLVK